MERLSFTEIKKNKNRPLILDGAIGSLLQEHDSPFTTSLWSSIINLSNSDKVIDVHKKYIEAGADIITTNTFRTNPTAFERADLSISNFDLVKSSVKLALDARDKNNVIIAGSNAPAEDCYQIERTIEFDKLVENHETHIKYLWESGVDLILCETFGHFDEIIIASEYCSKNSIPFILSIYLNSDLKLLSGEEMTSVIEFLNIVNPIAVGINCISPTLFTKVNLTLLKNLNWGFYLNCGSGNVTDEIISCGISPADYVESVKQYLQFEPAFIGSCCGSNPAHTKALKDAIDEIY